MNIIDIENSTNQSFDEILFQISKGNTIEGIKKGLMWMGFEQVKEWKLRFGYQFHIYSNDHLIEGKPHFHLKKESEKIDCRIFFNGTIFDCEKGNGIDNKIKNVLEYFLSVPTNQEKLILMWNHKNPKYLVP